MKGALILLILLPTFSFAQQHKWVEGGCGVIVFPPQKDTITKCYIFQGKDSLAYSISTINCNCDLYTSVGDHKLHSCKGLKMHTINTSFMYWCKNVTFVKGVKVREDKPHWDSNMSTESMVNGEYEQNGKEVGVHSIHMLKYRRINNNKYESVWVTLNNY